MRQKIARLFGGECQHDRMLVVDSVGVRRHVCESCGHISFEMAQMDAEMTFPESKRPDLPKVSGL